MKTIFKNKTGDIKDIFLLMIALLVLGIISIIGLTVYNAYKTSVESIGGISSETQTILNQGTNAIEFLDYIFVFVLVLLVILFIVSTFFINTHPIFFVVSLILLIIAIIIGVIFSNTFNSISNDAALADASSSFNFTTSILDNFPKWLLIFGFIALIVIYAKTRSSPTGV